MELKNKYLIDIDRLISSSKGWNRILKWYTFHLPWIPNILWSQCKSKCGGQLRSTENVYLATTQ